MLPFKTGRVCGKRLDCSHRCTKRAGSNHICACNRKWTMDLGCPHLITGPCSDYTNARTMCLETCGKLLDCGHPCAEECSSDICFCHVCFDKHSTVDVKAVEENSSGNEPVKLKLGATVNLLETEDIPLEEFARMSISASTQPVLKLSNPTPIYSKMTNAVGVLQKLAQQLTNSSMDVDSQPNEPTLVNSLSQNQLDQMKELLEQSPVDQDNPSTWDIVKIFKRCVNGHVFPDEQNYCHVCGCPAHGPTFAAFNVDALKSGLAKCSNGHYFDARHPVCNVCGMSSSL